MMVNAGGTQNAMKLILEILFQALLVQFFDLRKALAIFSTTQYINQCKWCQGSRYFLNKFYFSKSSISLMSEIRRFRYFFLSPILL